MKKFMLLLASASIFAAPLYAQSTAPTAIVAKERSQNNNATVLPANTEVNLTLNETLTTKGKSLQEGDTFDLTVAQDVMLGNYIIIPKGSRAVGEVTWLTGKGMFGKSGKMDIEVKYAEVSGQRVPLKGTFRQEGEGNTVATVAGVVVIPIAGLFITGKSGTIPAGRELLVRTANDFPVILPEGAEVAPVGIQAKALPSSTPQPAAQIQAQQQTQQVQQIPPNAIKIEANETCPDNTSLRTVPVGNQSQGNNVSYNYFCIPIPE